MPALSKKQQRLFGMVHAYNRGELHATGGLRRRIAALAGRISDDEARHFAQTPHEGLPEKKAQLIMMPEDARRLYGNIPEGLPRKIVGQVLPPTERAKRRRSFLGSVLAGTNIGSLAGGVLAGVAGLVLNGKARQDPATALSAARIGRLRAAFDSGRTGMAYGAGLGALAAAGYHLWDRTREDT